MLEDWELLGLLAAVAVFIGHEWLHSGLHESVPLSDSTTSVGAALAALAFAGVAVNSWYYANEG